MMRMKMIKIIRQTWYTPDGYVKSEAVIVNGVPVKEVIKEVENHAD